MENLKKFFFLVNQKYILLITLLFLFFTSSIFEIFGISLIGGYLAYLTKLNINELSALNKIFNFLELFGLTIDSSYSIATIIIIILVLRFLFQIIANYFILKFSINTSKNLRGRLVYTYFNLNYLDFINKDSSSSYNEITTLTDQFTNLLQVVLKLTSDVILLSFIALMLFVFSPNIFSFLFLIFLFLFLANKFLFSKKISSLGLKSNDLSEKIFKNLKEGLSSYKQIKVLNKTKFIIENLDNSLKKFSILNINYNFYLTVIRYLIELFIAVTLIITANLIYKYNNQSDAIIILTIFGISSIRALPLIISLINSANILFYSKNAINRLYYTLKLKIKDKTKKDLKSEKNFEFKSLELNNINFFYGKKQILKNLNLKIQKYDLALITGSSGSGKTTLLDIICGLLRVSDGQLIVNQKKTEDKINSFTNNIYYLSQNNYLLNDTLEKNIAFSQSTVNLEKIKKTITLCGLEDFYKKYLSNSEKNLGENASKISGGEMQRIALARAFYSDKKILVLDEFTSSLDRKTEDKILNTILELNKSKTILIVSHNSVMKKIANKIFKMEKGNLIKVK